MIYVWAVIIILVLFLLSRVLFNWRHRDSEAEQTKRTEDRLKFRLERWNRWRKKPVDDMGPKA